MVGSWSWRALGRYCIFFFEKLFASCFSWPFFFLDTKHLSFLLNIPKDIRISDHIEQLLMNLRRMNIFGDDPRHCAWLLAPCLEQFAPWSYSISPREAHCHQVPWNSTEESKPGDSDLWSLSLLSIILIITIIIIILVFILLITIIDYQYWLSVVYYYCYDLVSCHYLIRCYHYKATRYFYYHGHHFDPV